MVVDGSLAGLECSVSALLMLPSKLVEMQAEINELLLSADRE